MNFYQRGGLDVLFYPLITRERTHDVEFYVGLAKGTGGPVIDLGCGTGRITIEIASAGIDVVGVDPSSAMLDIARRELAARRRQTRKRVHFVQGTASDLGSLGPPARLITCGFRTMQLVLSDAEWTRTLLDVKEALSENGVFSFDVWTPAPPREFEPRAPTPVEIRVRGRDRVGTVQLVRREYDPASGVIREGWRFTLQSPDGGEEEQEASFSYRRMPVDHVNSLLDACGFEGEAGTFPTGRDSDAERVWVVSAR